MRKLVSTTNMSREEWLRWRKKGIGGSEVAALVGMHPYLSPFSIYMDKIGELEPQDDNEAMRIGRDLEEYVAQRFTEKTGIRVRKNSSILMDDECDYMIADIDRWSKKDGIGLECKTMSPNSKAVKGLEDDSVPPQYYIQCQWYMMITGLNKWHLAILVLGRAFYTFEIDRNDEDITVLRKAAKDFWIGNVLPRKMPPPDGTESAQKAISHLIQGVDNEATVRLDSAVDEIKHLQEINEQIDTLKQEADAIKQKFLLELGASGIGWNDGYEVSAKEQVRRTFDTKRFKAEHPELDLDPYYKSSVSRPFKYKIFDCEE